MSILRQVLSRKQRQDHASDLKKHHSFGVERRAPPPQTFIEGLTLMEVSDT
jgi:hypothetical protein